MGTLRVVESPTNAKRTLFPDNLHLLLDAEVYPQGDEFRLRCVTVKA